ncbi:MAG TPA: hypothetical protein PLP19_11140 [bacterium]|nr:hypothetical protein [bacterium]HPN44036.1 hypothetical protein [bacterium]
MSVKRSSWFVSALLLITLLMLTTGVWAQDSGSKFKFGITERLRNTYYNNITDYRAKETTIVENKETVKYDDETDFIRVRTNVWAQYSFTPSLMAFVQLTNEFRPYLIDPADRDFTFDEIFFDNLYLKWTVGSATPVTFTVGRQNLMYGEGFVIMDGSPWDGSRSIYQDAVKVSLKKGTTTIDLLGISNTAIEERLPVLRGGDLQDGKLKAQPKDQPMNDNLEQAIGLYMVRKGESGCQFEGYYIYKMEDPEPVKGTALAPKDELSFSTIGARYSRPLTAKLSVTTEWAYQFGSQGDIDQQSYGGYAYLSYLVREKTKGTLSGGLTLLSGDDPTTANNEGWNPVFSRWPKWSELYIYSYLGEEIQGARRVAYWTNLMQPYISWNCSPTPKINVTATFLHLQAIHNRMTGMAEFGKVRGNELQLWVKFNLSKSLSAHILYDHFFPGDFYADGSDSGQFIRGELMYKFSR